MSKPTEKFFQTNREAWDRRTKIHLTSDFYDLPGFQSGKNMLKEIEMEALSGKVDGKELLHLQCHFGLDTLSLARLGARVTGCDFSEASIETASLLTIESGLEAEFVSSHIYDLPEHLHREYDIVFTSYGVIWWLPDLKRWAEIISHFLKPGGFFYIAEHHPALMMYDFESGNIGYPYFHRDQPVEEVVSGTYAEPGAQGKFVEYSWSHSLEEIVQPLLDSGLILEKYKEFPYSPYNCFAGMTEVGPSRYVFGSTSYPLPHVFSLLMRKPDTISHSQRR